LALKENCSASMKGTSLLRQRRAKLTLHGIRQGPKVPLVAGVPTTVADRTKVGGQGHQDIRPRQGEEETSHQNV